MWISEFVQNDISLEIGESEEIYGKRRFFEGMKNLYAENR